MRPCVRLVKLFASVVCFAAAFLWEVLSVALVRVCFCVLLRGVFFWGEGWSTLERAGHSSHRFKASPFLLCVTCVLVTLEQGAHVQLLNESILRRECL